MTRSAALVVMVVWMWGFGPGAVGQGLVLPEETFAYDESAPASGWWLGEFTAPGGTAVFGSLVIERGGAGSWRVMLSALWLGALDTPCQRVAVDGRRVRFGFPTSAGMLRFEGEVSDDGQRLTGTMQLAGHEREKDPPTGAFTVQRVPRPTDLPDVLAFSGELDLPGNIALGMTIALAPTAGGNWVGHVDVPMQQLFGYPLVNLRAEEQDGATSISALMPVMPPASLELRIDGARARLTGRFVQGPHAMRIEFVRQGGYVGGKVNRPQHPEPPYPYRTRQLTVRHPDGHKLGGTLTIPDAEQFGPGPYPTAVLISGSGGQDRDETVFGHKPFLVLADYLTRHGIAVMRYDDRGVGESAVEYAAQLAGVTMADLATDTRVIVNRLKTINEVDAERLGLIGHSEGGMIAPMVARGKEDIAFIVMLAGTAVRGDALLMLQLRKLYEAIGVDGAIIDEAERCYRAVAELVAADAPKNEIEEAAKRLIRAQARAMEQAPPAADDPALAAGAKQFTTLPVKFLLSYDPRPALRALQCPVLALNGTLDLQVWHEQNLPVIEETIEDAGGDVTVKRYEGLNHLFQPAKTGLVTEYATIETTMDERVLADIVAWIREKVGGAGRRK